MKKTLYDVRMTSRIDVREAFLRGRQTCHMNAQEEIVTIVDSNNQVIGAVPRHKMRQENLIHRAAYILVFNSHGELFVHRRTLTKDIYPGYYDIAAGGVVLAGESYEESARRELEEELGIREKELKNLFDFFYQDGANQVWGRAFSCNHDGIFSLQKEEVEWGSFMPLPSLRQMAPKKPFTPDGLYLLGRLTA